MTGRRRDLRRAVGRVRRSPSLLGAGAAVAWAWVGVVLLVGLASSPADALAGWLLVAAGQGQAGFLGTSVPRATMLLVRAAILTGLLLVSLEVAWFLVALPVDATVAALAWDETDGWREAIRRTAGNLPRLAGVALLYRGIAGMLFPVGVGLALAAYLTLGTVLEALGYAAGLYAFVPWYVAPTAAFAALFVGRRGAASAPGRPDLAACADREGSIRAVVRETAVRALSRPRRTLADGAVETALLSVPVVVGVAGLSALAQVDLGSDDLGLAGFVAVLVAFVATGAAGHATATAFRAFRAERSPGRDRSVAGGSVPGWGHLRRSVPVLKVGTLVGLVVVAALAGASVRYVDATPGSRETPPPGAVTASDDPDRIVGDATAVVGRTSHTVVQRDESRRAYDNGTTGEWNRGIELRVKHDRDDERTRIVALLGESASAATYVDQSTFAQAGFDGTNATDESAVRDAEWVVYPRIPGVVFEGRGSLLQGGSVYETPRDADWRIAGETDDRLVLVSEDPETATAYAGGSVPADAVSNVTVRMEVEAGTGYVRRVDVAFDQHLENEPFDLQRRATVRFDGYRSTNVERPEGVTPGPVPELLDVLFY